MDNDYKEVIILSKSRKHRGYCVAGIDCSNRSLVRLISNNPINHYATIDENIEDKNGKIAEVLDDVIIESDLSGIVLPFQPENITLNTNSKFINKGNYNKINLKKIVDLISNKYDYIYFNTNPCLSILELQNINKKDMHSLELIKPNILVLRVKDVDKHRLKGNILYKNRWYNNFAVTDINFENSHYNEVANSQCGYKTLHNPYLLISLGEEYNGYHYKLIASILDI